MIQSFLETLQRAWPFLIQGVQITIEIWAISIVIGIVVGLFSCLMKISRFKVSLPSLPKTQLPTSPLPLKTVPSAISRSRTPTFTMSGTTFAFCVHTEVR